MRRSERQELKRPDQFTEKVGGIFAQFSKNPKAVAGGFVAIVLVLIIAMYGVNQSEKTTHQSEGALFHALKALDSDSEKLEEPVEDLLKGLDVAGKGKDKEKKKTPEEIAKAEEARKERERLLKAPTEEAYQESIRQLKLVIDTYPGSPAAYEAHMNLGNIYYRRSEHDKSKPHYEEAVGLASNTFQKSFAHYALGVSLEESGKLDEAVTQYYRGLNLKETALKGDFLLAIGRSQELLKDVKTAKATYQRIINEMSKTPYAETAKIFLARLN